MAVARLRRRKGPDRKPFNVKLLLRRTRHRRVHKPTAQPQIETETRPARTHELSETQWDSRTTTITSPKVLALEQTADSQSHPEDAFPQLRRQPRTLPEVADRPHPSLTPLLSRSHTTHDSQVPRFIRRFAATVLMITCHFHRSLPSSPPSLAPNFPNLTVFNTLPFFNSLTSTSNGERLVQHYVLRTCYAPAVSAYDTPTAWQAVLSLVCALRSTVTHLPRGECRPTIIPPSLFLFSGTRLETVSAPDGKNVRGVSWSTSTRLPYFYIETYR